jgi:hypothetical protein
MHGYGALVEWYRQGKTEVLGEKTCLNATLSIEILHRLVKY